MKKLVASKSRFLIGTYLLFAVLLISNSCNKSSYNSMTGMTNKDGVAHPVTSNTGIFDSGSLSTNGTSKKPEIVSYISNFLASLNSGVV